MEGPVVAVNAALDGLSYQSDEGFAGLDALSIEVNDQGQTGDDGRIGTASGNIGIATDGVAPVVEIVGPVASPRAGGISSVDIRFSEPVVGFDIADLSLMNDLQEVRPLDAGDLTQVDEMTWRLDNLFAKTDTSGFYQLDLLQDAIQDLAGNLLVADDTVNLAGEPLATGASVQWSNRPGDANRDGKFNQFDLLDAFDASKYKQGDKGPASWEEGNWDNDPNKRFDELDLILAAQLGHYVNKPPIVMGDAYHMTTGTVLDGPSVLSNDDDSHGGAENENNLPLRARLIDDVSNGILQLRADGTFTYTPNADFVGVDGFSYRAIDSVGSISEIATVAIVVELPTAIEL